MGIEVVPFRPEHGEAVFQLRVRTFSSASGLEFDPSEPYIPDDRRVVALDGDRLLGHAGAWPFRQTFGGRPVACGGVGAVIVEATHRGQGIAGRLLAAAIARMRELGDVISTLYPATVAPYRRWGWEVAGVRVPRTVATRALTGLPAPDRPTTIRPSRPDELDTLMDLHRRVVATEAGGATGEAWLRRILVPDDDDGDELHVAERDGEVVGFLMHSRSSPSGQDHSAFDFQVQQLVAADRDAELALWRFVGSAWSVGGVTRFISQPADPLLHDLPEIDVRDVPHPEHWMTRILDAPGAIAARGYPPGLEVTVELDLADDRIATNHGRFVLEVAGGEGRLTPGGAGRVVIDVRRLAPLYTGYAPAPVLARRGAMRGATAADVEALQWAFAGPTPWLRDYF
jgi:predicted acetyltransferase